MPSSHNATPSLHRKATKKSSFLSLRKEKKSSETAISSSSANDSTTSPSSFQFEEISRPVPSRPMPLGSRRSHSINKSMGSLKDDVSSSRRSRGKERERYDTRQEEDYQRPSQDDEAFDFPVADDTISWIEPEAWARPRARSGRSKKSDHDHVPFLNRSIKYPFRDSGSSSLSQFDPPPQTPMDDMSFRDSIFNIPVMVAAPVSGVEAMDALVDGMNGFGGDDHSFYGSRSKFSKSGHHPLYHPPLPTPPPGITLGGGKPRTPRQRHSSSDDESTHTRGTGTSHKGSHRSGASRKQSSRTLTQASLRSQPSKESINTFTESSGSDEPTPTPPPSPSPPPAPAPKTVIPSISEIIRNHAPLSQQTRSRPVLSRKTSSIQGDGHSSVWEQPKPQTTDEEADLVSRSSVDTIAEEVRQTVRNHVRNSMISPPPMRSNPYFSQPSSSLGHDNESYVSSPGPSYDSRRGSSIYSHSTSSDQAAMPPLDLNTLTKANINSPSQSIAQYIRSSRLTSILQLTRSPHASRESPLTVSFSDLGSPTGVPIIVFLGLGCVRHLMGLYDEMAGCLGVRLITIDRWGLGRTSVPRSKSARGIPEWASVVEEVLDRLNIDQCSVMAHSAGAPYALAFANKFPERIRGDVCLLAPWVGGGEGAAYKWLRYVPTGILKTAQAAEWKVQAWMLGKPPTLAYEGIGFDVKSPGKSSIQSPSVSHAASPRSPSSPTSSYNDFLATPNLGEAESRKSMSSGIFSDYDDLRDFDGRFESMSTLGRRRSSGSQRSRTVSEKPVFQRKPSKGFLGRLKGGIGGSPTQTPSEERPSSSSGGKRLKALRSMSSLKGRASGQPSAWKPPRPPSLPHAPIPDMSFGIDGSDWNDTIRGKSHSTPPVKFPKSDAPSSPERSSESLFNSPRTGGRRSISFSVASAPPVPPLPLTPTTPTQETISADPELSYQASLGNALIAASHAESSRGTHADLLQILNHDRQPWGFSYSAYPHTVRVWYGDRDERIPETAVRWMEGTMGPGKCHVKIIKGADHALMFKSAVVVEIMEYISECWRYGMF
ncbi:hypothetical protein BXZ70DRAFT_893344 [Cristinia sonorae]|uniref:AB hydrolase-1 domain-containing protein n=1 Tax=Cristinia sonorae TaxID=1940300 RepID=A0A8K0UNE3_9AGAR|nr:hypothetical protein BXZ70DRAFT_893344 [Cristinia sonorae]